MSKWKRDRNELGFLLVLTVLFALVCLSGCCTLKPDSAGIEYAHISHPLQGFPFGPNDEEATLDTVQIATRKNFGNVYIEQALGYRFSKDCDFAGDHFLYNGRVGYTFWRAH